MRTIVRFFYDCYRVGTLGEVSAHGGEFPLCFYIYFLIKSLGGCSFGLFNYDSYVSFQNIGLTWGI